MSAVKAAYFGIDALRDCLNVLIEHGYEITSVFTIEDDAYDRTAEICRFAQEHHIPLHTTRVTAEDIRALEDAGVSISVTAGYPWKIPLSDTIMQLNIHPALLPVGRGAWPMPAAILKNCSSGVTLHKLAQDFDRGDILLQEEIPLDRGETLVTLSDKIAQTAPRLLGEFLERPQFLWENARKQAEGEYWPEPSDEDRTISPTDSAAKAERVLRAFDGYGSLCTLGGVPIVIEEGRCLAGGGALPKEGLTLELSDGVLLITKWHPYFREITLADRSAMEAIRSRHPSELSDFTFPLLYCWRKALQLQVHIGQDFFLVKSGDSLFCPVGDAAQYIPYLKGLLALEKQLTLRFCDTAYACVIRDAFGEQAVCTLCRDDCDYILENQLLESLSGGALGKRRNDFHHYSSLLPPPETEAVAKENLHHVRELSQASRAEDYPAQEEAIRHFEELGLEGVLVKRGQRYVGFALASQKEPDVMQGHFSKTMDEERGAALYTVRACSVQGMEKYSYTNLEDDMGDEGLRCFKQSLHADLISSFTIDIKEVPLFEKEMV